MKKLLILLILAALSPGLLAQDQPINKNLTRQDYLRKSRTQSTIGWILVGLGTAIIIAPSTDNNTNAHPNSEGFTISLDFDEYFYVTGAVFIGASIPLFIAASRNKDKAAELSWIMKMEKGPVFMSGPYRAFPALGIRLQIR